MEMATSLGETFLMCPQCLNTFTDPKQLPCTDNFCLACLPALMEQHAGNPSIKCSVCKSICPVPGSIDNFPTNTFLVRLLYQMSMLDRQRKVCDACKSFPDRHRTSAVSRCEECMEFLCHKCYLAHIRTSATRGHSLKPLTEEDERTYQFLRPPQTLARCQRHTAEDSRIFCYTCDRSVCEKCIFTVCRDHKIFEMGGIVREFHNRVKALQRDLDGHQKKPATAMKQVENGVEKLGSLETSLRRKVESRRQELHRLVDKYGDKLTNQMDEAFGAQFGQAHEDLNDLQTQEASIQTLSDYSSHLLRYGTPEEIASGAPHVYSRMRKLANYVYDQAIPSLHASHSVRTPAGDFQTQLESFLGCVTISKPTETQVDVTPKAAAPSAKPKDVYVKRRGIYTLKDLPVTFAAVTSMHEVLQQATVNDLTKESNMVFAATTSGVYVFITDADGERKCPSFTLLGGQNVLSAMFHSGGYLCCLVVTSATENEVIEASIAGTVLKRTQVATGSARLRLIPEGMMVITNDFWHEKNLKILGIPEKTSTITVSSNPRQPLFENPYYVDVFPERIGVTDNVTHSLFMFDSQGILQWKYGGVRGSSESQLDSPMGVAFDRQGLIYIVDSGNDRVVVLTWAGKFKRLALSRTSGLRKISCILINNGNRMVLVHEKGVYLRKL